MRQSLDEDDFVAVSETFCSTIISSHDVLVTHVNHVQKNQNFLDVSLQWHCFFIRLYFQVLNGIDVSQVPRGTSLNAAARSLVRTAYGDTGSFNDLAPGELDVLLGKTKCNLLMTVELKSSYQLSSRVSMVNISRQFSPTVKT